MDLLAQAAGTGGGSQTAEVVLFWILAPVAIGAAIAMITMRNVVHGALMLVVNFFAIAGLFLALQSSFMAIIQIIVYAGAIMVLFLFVIMLLGISRDDLLVETDPWRRAGAWGLGLLLIAAVSLVFVGTYTGAGSICGQAPTGAEAVGQTVATCAGLVEQVSGEDGSVGFAAERLFQRYTFAFEFVSLLLIVAIVGAMVVGRRSDLPDVPGGIPAEGFLPTAAPSLQEAGTSPSAGTRTDGEAV